MTGFVLADDASFYQTNLNLVERISRLEEGQKAIIVEMRTRFKAVDERFAMLEKSIDERFEAVDKRFETIDKRFEAIDKRFEAIDKRFESLEQRFDKRFESLEQRLDKRFESLEQRFGKRFESLENQVSTLAFFLFTMLSTILALIIGLIVYIVRDRKTVSEKEEKYHKHEPILKKPQETIINVDAQNTKSADQLIKEGFKIPKHLQEKIRDVFNFLNQFPEMRPVLHPA
jgi:chaperonin cofactor prefoldin